MQFESTADLHDGFLWEKKSDPGATIIFICHFTFSHLDILVALALLLGLPLLFQVLVYAGQ